jgi:hypothetical protein
MHGSTTKLTDGFVQSEMLQIVCGSGSNSVDLPEGTKTFVVTNPEKLAGAWISFGAEGADLKAVIGVGHYLAGAERLIVEKTPGVSKVAAIATASKHSETLVIYVECGQGGLSEARKF